MTPVCFQSASRPVSLSTGCVSPPATLASLSCYHPYVIQLTAGRGGRPGTSQGRGQDAGVSLGVHCWEHPRSPDNRSERPPGRALKFAGLRVSRRLSALKRDPEAAVQACRCQARVCVYTDAYPPHGGLAGAWKTEVERTAHPGSNSGCATYSLCASGQAAEPLCASVSVSVLWG